MSPAQRKQLCQEFMAAICERRDQFGAVLKADTQALIDAADQWCEDKKLEYNAALPLPGRTAMGAALKTELLVKTVRRRFELGL